MYNSDCYSNLFLGGVITMNTAVVTQLNIIKDRKREKE